MPDTHARFSPSAANRRIHCPPSLLLEEQFEEGESVYAAEGTAGHALAEHLIRKHLKQRTTRPTSEYYKDELLEAVDEYVSFVIGEIEDARRECQSPVLLVEQRIDASEYPDASEYRQRPCGIAGQLERCLWRFRQRQPRGCTGRGYVVRSVESAQQRGAVP